MSEDVYLMITYGKITTQRSNNVYIFIQLFSSAYRKYHMPIGWNIMEQVRLPLP